MTLLEFAMPTWKRPKQLASSASSIAEQGSPLVISHHLCDTETLPVVEELKAKYPNVRAVACELGTAPDYSDSFRQVFRLTDSEYTWTFGDDDILLPGAVEAILPVLERREFDFIHVSEISRTDNSRGLIKGTLAELANSLGWLDMTGFISCNIVKTERLNEATSLKSWDLYAKSAFVHCLALYEVLHDKKCAFLDNGLVDSKKLENYDETAERWTAGNVGLRYHYVDEALLDMRKRGILGEVAPKFFRYLSYHLWDRFMTQILNSYATDQDFKVTDYLLDLLRRSLNLASLLENASRKRYTDEIMEVKRAIIDHSAALQYALQRAAVMTKLEGNHGRERYDFSYLPRRLPKESPRA